ncbi:hypothetical protein Q604_UNBC02813G0001, partial [human gut metagenome]
NVAHPFREGNGRSMRLWLDHMLCAELQKTIDWSQIDKEKYLSAMERSPVNDLAKSYISWNNIVWILCKVVHVPLGISLSKFFSN